MDKPVLLETILNLNPDIDIHYVQMLAVDEIARQHKEQVSNILSKKPLSVLKEIVEYDPANISSDNSIASISAPEVKAPLSERKTLSSKKRKK